MRAVLSLLIAFAVTSSVYGAAGDVIRTFALAGQPSSGVRGLAFDWSDANVWAAGPNATGDVWLAKFNPRSGSLVGSWRPLDGAYWCFDIGYGYRIGGKRYIIHLDDRAPRYRVSTTTGSYYGSFPNPYSGGWGTGAACDWVGRYVYASNYSFTTIYRWNIATWSPWANIPTRPPMGIAEAWGRVFVVTTVPDYKIYEFNAATGSLQRTIPLNDWGQRYMVGMSRGRINAIGGEESVFLALFHPSNSICEVSVGDITGTAVAPSSLGKIKALFP